MNPDKTLHACVEWQRLAEAEAEAIQANDWPRLAACQNAIAQLQTEISGPTDGEPPRLGGARPPQPDELRLRIAELIKLETHNGALLADKIKLARTKLQDLNRCTCNLRRVQKSYAPGRAPGWTSYS